MEDDFDMPIGISLTPEELRLMELRMKDRVMRIWETVEQAAVSVMWFKTTNPKIKEAETHVLEALVALQKAKDAMVVAVKTT